MAKDAELKISLGDIIIIIKQHWKIVLLIAFICAILGGVLGIIRDPGFSKDPITADTVEQEQLYEENSALHDAVSSTTTDALISLRHEWLHLAKAHNNHPLMSIDPYECEYEHITLGFSPESGNHSSLVRDWIGSVNNDELFSNSDKELIKYKNSLILVPNAAYPNNETEVIVIGAEGLDLPSCSDYLTNYFKTQAKKDNQELLRVSATYNKGYLEEIYLFQKGNADAMNSVYSALRNTTDIDAVFPAPSQPTSMIASQGISKKKIIKSVIVGLLFGFVIGIIVTTLLAFLRKKAISCNQIEDTFDIELLGDFSQDTTSALNVLNANLDLMVDPGSRIMIVDSCKDKSLVSLASQWTENGKRLFIDGNNIIDDYKTIDTLQDVEGIILGVHIGESNLNDIQRIILKAEKLNKKILGFVQL